MKAKSTKTTVNRKINWAAKVRRFKPQMNVLTTAEGQHLFKKALADIHGLQVCR